VCSQVRKEACPRSSLRHRDDVTKERGQALLPNLEKINVALPAPKT